MNFAIGVHLPPQAIGIDPGIRTRSGYTIGQEVIITSEAFTTTWKFGHNLAGRSGRVVGFTRGGGVVLEVGGDGETMITQRVEFRPNSRFA
ncbi:MAG: hypothetical protein RB292_00845 [Patescibacteria group bacterium]|nr:hypothetical protein [Patescibacteria group bacterium]